MWNQRQVDGIGNVPPWWVYTALRAGRGQSLYIRVGSLLGNPFSGLQKILCPKHFIFLQGELVQESRLNISQRAKIITVYFIPAKSCWLKMSVVSLPYITLPYRNITLVENTATSAHLCLDDQLMRLPGWHVTQLLGAELSLLLCIGWRSNPQYPGMWLHLKLRLLRRGSSSNKASKVALIQSDWWQRKFGLEKRHQGNANEEVPCEDTERRWSSVSKERRLSRSQPDWHVDLGLPDSRTARKEMSVV